jgi:hypothetical protein
MSDCDDAIELRAWESLAEARIREAQEAGEFDNLPGKGQPIPGIDGVDDPWWWIKQKIRRENLSLLPPALQIRLDVENGLAEIWRLPTESLVGRAVLALNEQIRAANLAAVWGPPSTTSLLDVEEVLAEWRQRRMAARLVPPGGTGIES